VKAFQFLMGGAGALTLWTVGAADVQAQKVARLPKVTDSDPADAPAPLAPDVSAADPDALWYSPEPDYVARPWTFSADGLIMMRSAPDSVALLRTGMLQGGDVVLNANDLDFDTSGGWRFGAQRTGQCCDLEIVYFQMDGFEAVTTVPGEVEMVTDRDGAHLSIIAPWVEYRSRLYNSEFNLRRPRNEWLTLLIGLRFLELDEDYKVAGLSDDNVPIGGDEVLETFSQRAKNCLYGVQIGADGLLFSRGRLSVQGLLKAGIYGNHADQLAVQFDGHDDETRQLYSERGEVAFVGDLALTGKYQISEHLAFRAGYQLMWLDGVATATNQIRSNDFGIGPGGASSRVDTGNTVFYHGAVLGGEMTW